MSKPIVYVVDGDTVELVQELEQTAVTLDEIVVTGGVAGADSAGVRADAASAGERARAAALRPPAAGVDDQRNALAAARMANALDSASVLASRSIVALRRDDRVVLLVGRVPEESLQALAEKIR